VNGSQRYDIRARDVRRNFGQHEVLRGVNLDVPKGATIVLVGPSGCGKSVFLKHIVGLLTADSGEMTVLGEDIGRVRPEIRTKKLCRFCLGQFG
jgi:ABC-type sugar transport system ATPase subunit